MYVKTYLLQQLRLVPQAMLDMFNTITRHENETYKAFVSSLVILLDQYLSSRKVKDQKDVKDLLISDRIKCSLSEQPLSHLLRAESTRDEFARPDFIRDLLDNYLATHGKDDKPVASALGMGVPRSARANQPRPAQRPQRVDYKSPNNATELSKGVTPAKAEVTRRCFKCNSPSHVFKDCPQRATVAANSGQKAAVGAGTHARVSRCRTVSHSQSAGPVEVNEFTRDEGSQSEAPPSQTGCCAISMLPEVGSRTVHSDIPVPTCSFTTSQEQLALPLAPLTHVGIRIKHLPSTVSGLQDSGSEINVINTSVLKGLSTTPIGRITFRGIVGEPDTADLVPLQIRLDESVLNDLDSIDVVFAVCDESNERCILSLPTIYKLHDVLNNKLVCDHDIAVPSSVDAVTRKHVIALSCLRTTLWMILLMLLLSRMMFVVLVRLMLRILLILLMLIMYRSGLLISVIHKLMSLLKSKSVMTVYHKLVILLNKISLVIYSRITCYFTKRNVIIASLRLCVYLNPVARKSSPWLMILRISMKAN